MSHKVKKLNKANEIAQRINQLALQIAAKDKEIFNHPDVIIPIVEPKIKIEKKIKRSKRKTKI